VKLAYVPGCIRP